MIIETHFIQNINFKIHGYITHKINHSSNTFRAGAAILVTTNIRRIYYHRFRNMQFSSNKHSNTF